jgi:hypothetical protein
MKSAQQRGLMPSTGVGVGILASVLLALLTLSVFYVLQDYGPESAIRKYNEAVLNGDSLALNAISSQPIDSPDGEWLQAQVHSFLAAGGRLRLETIRREPTTDLAEVEYVLPDPPAVPFLFVVTKDNHVWKVNPSATHAVIDHFSGRK